MVKKFATFSLFIFIAIVAGVVIVGLVSSNNNQQAIVGSNADGVSQVSNITGVDPSVSTLTLSTAELAKHNSGSSCWLLISGKIYDVTTYLYQHPGNAGTILPTCGTDATVAYDTKDRPNPRPHSANAQALLADYFVGNLNQILKLKSGATSSSGQAVQATQTKPDPTPVATIPIAITAQTQISQTTLALTSAELAKHNSANSCWLLISGKIYDVTTYIRQHPGGANEILPTCGTDATAAYANRGGTGTHSSSANADLAMYYIGDLNQTVTTTNPTNSTSPTIVSPNPTLPTSGRGDDEFDD